MRNQNLKMMIISALFCAIIAICAQLSFPILPQVPFTMQNLAIALTIVILGRRYGTLAILLYVLLGAAGAPVFAGGNGGFGILVGKTGGYLIGYIIAAFVMGTLLDRGKLSFTKAFIVNVLGLVVIYAFGVAQLKFVAHLSWPQAVAFGAAPFVLLDLVKVAIASYLGNEVRRRLQHAGLLPAQYGDRQRAA
ncbi:biotin transporter BioY [Aneurinibacillus tyrosinisolvens]|uniref:biotin transporter BioY n=1 Tax=Aneurinibacillus tyrosinisolvens TaxID=1443435 RepID=UPI00063FC528|nr:biotin transporter BioY [Aneurinibacillus tyrosinisolvens]